MKKKLIAVTAAVLVLAGCSAAPVDETTDSARTVPSSSAPAETSEPTAAPLAEQPEPEASGEFSPDHNAQSLGFKDADDMFLRSVQSSWSGDIPSDAELLAAGAYACEQIATGVVRDTIIAVQGDSETAMRHNQVVVSSAGYAWCPTD